MPHSNRLQKLPIFIFISIKCKKVDKHCLDWTAPKAQITYVYFRRMNQTTTLLTPTLTAFFPQGVEVICPCQGTHQAGTNIYYDLAALTSLDQALGEGNNRVKKILSC